MCKKESYIVGAALVAVVTMVMFIPVMGMAGSLEPSAAPAPTMKTLDQIPPAWSQNLPGAQRFELVLGGAAVLDKETGLVWEKQPSNYAWQWPGALNHCIDLYLGGRGGWHLPTIEQLMSLVDRSNAGPIKLPYDHPFINVQQEYWVATSSVIDPTRAWHVYFDFGGIFDPGYKTTPYPAWCVRGGQGYDAY